MLYALSNMWLSKMIRINYLLSLKNIHAFESDWALNLFDILSRVLCKFSTCSESSRPSSCVSLFKRLDNSDLSPVANCEGRHWEKWVFVQLSSSTISCFPRYAEVLFWYKPGTCKCDIYCKRRQKCIHTCKKCMHIKHLCSSFHDVGYCLILNSIGYVT